MLVNPTSAQTQSEVRNVQTAVDKLGQRVRIFNVTTRTIFSAPGPAATGRRRPFSPPAASKRRSA
jgi:hypothetical protein